MTIIMSVLSTVIGALNLSMIFAHLSGRSVPFGASDRSVYIAAMVLALVMCSLGIQITLKTYGPKSLGMVLGALCGIMLLVVSVSVLAGKSVPVLVSHRNALVFLGVFILIKWTVAVSQTAVNLIRG